eukprot:11832200-Ditylum_brightwellii.AAC.1
MKRISTVEVANAGANAAVIRININHTHKLLGHTDEDQTRHTAKHLGWEITSSGFKLCEACAVGKAK